MDAKIGIEVSQRVEFSCTYLVKNDDKYTLNSHYYRFEATVCDLNSYESTGRVISFEDFKQIMKSVVPDKKFLYDSNDVNQLILSRDFNTCGVTSYEFKNEVSAERLLEEISLTLVEALSEYEGIYLKETKLRENTNSYVSWKQEVIDNGI